MTVPFQIDFGIRELATRKPVRRIWGRDLIEPRVGTADLLTMEAHLPHRPSSLTQLRDQISLASYEVDPVAVADAIIRRRWHVDVVRQSSPQSRERARLRTRARVRCVAGHGSGIGSRALAA